MPGFGLLDKTAVPLTDAVYDQVERIAAQRHLTVPELLRQAVEQMVRLPSTPTPRRGVDWEFPAARHLGELRASAEELRLLANESGD